MYLVDFGSDALLFRLCFHSQNNRNPHSALRPFSIVPSICQPTNGLNRSPAATSSPQQRHRAETWPLHSLRIEANGSDTLHRKDADHAHEGRIEDTRLPALRAGSLRACRDRGRCNERTTGAHRIGRRPADRRVRIDDTRRSLGGAPVRKSPGRRRQLSRPPADRSGIPLRAR